MQNSFSYRQALESGCFHQVPLMSSGEFSSATAQRRLVGFPLVMDWETLDREDIMPPIAYQTVNAPTTAMHLLLLARGELLLREETGFRAWRENDLRPLYAHWQLITLARLSDALRRPFSLEGLSRGVDEFRSRLERLAQDTWAGLTRNEDDRQLELLLTRTQSLFLPVVQGGLWIKEQFFQADGSIGELDTAQWAHDQRKRSDYASAAAEVGADAALLEQKFDWAMSEATRRDPIGRWRVLVNEIPRRKTDEVAGEALIARDFYDAARLLAMWHREISGRDLVAEYDNNTGYRLPAAMANKRLYGYEHIDGNRAALPGILEAFDLYPWRVVLLVEGPSEISMLETIFNKLWGLSLEELGIVGVVLGGAGLPKKSADVRRYVEILSALRRFPNYFFLLFDDEGNAAAFARELERATTGYEPFGRTPILEPDPWQGQNETPAGWSADEYVPLHAPEKYLWNEDLEADNFTLDEICSTIDDLAAQDELPEFHLDPVAVAAAASTGRRGIATVAVKLAQDLGFDRLTKPDLAAALGELAVTRPETAGGRRPVLTVAEHLRRLSGAHRQLRGRLREDERERLRKSE